jgi:hypothetical protein
VVNGREGIGVSRPLRIEYPGAFYHAASRGNERKTVFQRNPDREKYKKETEILFAQEILDSGSSPE